MSQQDIDNEISPVSAPKGTSRGLFVGGAIGLSLLVSYFALSGTNNEKKSKISDAGDKPAYTLAYADKDLSKLNMDFSQREQKLITQYAATRRQIDEQKKKAPEAQQETNTPQNSREFKSRLGSSMVTFYDKKSFEYQGAYSAKQKLKNGKLSNTELAKTMLAFNSKSKNSRFADSVYTAEIDITNATKLTDLEYTILQGKQIPAILETPINSKLPGPIRAIISENIYGESGRTVLIPRGSRLIGAYNSQTERGQSRVYVVWSRVITPNHINIRINSPGGDQMGTIGLSGKVNRHFFQRFGNAILLSIIGGTVQTTGVGANQRQNARDNLQQILGSGFRATAASTVAQNQYITPTITLQQGARVVVSVAKDIKFKQVKNLIGGQ